MNKHYFERYLKFIEWHVANQSNIIGYTEKHHILPRCYSGDNLPDNIVKLPIRAHLLAHWMLHKAFPDCLSLAYAFRIMVHASCQKPNLRAIEIAKISTAKTQSKILKGRNDTPQIIAMQNSLTEEVIEKRNQWYKSQENLDYIGEQTKLAMEDLDTKTICGLKAKIATYNIWLEQGYHTNKNNGKLLKTINTPQFEAKIKYRLKLYSEGCSIKEAQKLEKQLVLEMKEYTKEKSAHYKFHLKELKEELRIKNFSRSSAKSAINFIKKSLREGFSYWGNDNRKYHNTVDNIDKKIARLKIYKKYFPESFMD